MGLFALGFILGGLFGGGIMALMNASKVNELSAEGSLGKGNSGEEMNAEYDKGYQSGYDAGYKRAMLDYGLEDDKPCEDCVSRQAVLACEQHIWTDCGVVSVEDIKALPPVTPTPTECEDAVSREAAIATADFTDCPNVLVEDCWKMFLGLKFEESLKEGDAK